MDFCECSLKAELQSSKLWVGVRFSSLASDNKTEYRKLFAGGVIGNIPRSERGEFRFES
jgi:hypothetical protein